LAAGWLPPGRTIEDVAADLRFIMSRHSSLRTRLRFAADGRRQQELMKAGEVLLEVVDAGDADPAQVASAVHHRFDQRSLIALTSGRSAGL
jgi:hypothetical protein